MRNSRWVRLPAYVTGSVNQELLLRNEYLAAENQILRAKLPGRVRLSNPERITLAEIGKQMGRKALRDVACVARPDTILGWYRRLVAQKFDGSKQRQYPGRPPVTSEVETLVVRMARENSGWGYDRIVGALANLGHQCSDQTVKNILRRHGIAPAPKRRQVTSWKDFLAAHMNVLPGCDFFTVEVLSWRSVQKLDSPVATPGTIGGNAPPHGSLSLSRNGACGMGEPAPAGCLGIPTGRKPSPSGTTR